MNSRDSEPVGKVFDDVTYRRKAAIIYYDHLEFARVQPRHLGGVPHQLV